MGNARKVSLTQSREIIATTRQKWELTQDALAHFLGVDRVSVTRWETGTAGMSAGMYLIILRLSVCDIMPDTVFEMMIERKGNYVKWARPKKKS